MSKKVAKKRRRFLPKTRALPEHIIDRIEVLMNEAEFPTPSMSPAYRQMELATLMAEIKKQKAIAGDEGATDEARESAKAELIRLGKACAQMQMTKSYFT